MESYLELILREVGDAVHKIKREEIQGLAESLMHADRIFVDGAGRSRLAAEGFAMRLTQMGLAGMIVGSPMTTAIRQGDLYLGCSGSAATPALVEHIKRARACGASTALITANCSGEMMRYADKSVVIPVSAKFSSERTSRQPMGSLFEQSLEILLDSLVLQVMEEKKITNEYMIQMHSNLE